MELLATGREAQVYAVDERRVLRRYRDPERSASIEAELLDLLGAAGYPVPEVDSWAGPDLVLERIDGPRLSDAMTSGQVSSDEGAAVLADLHDRLHALPWEGGTLLHIDLHPENVLMGADGPIVIDWTNARVGAAGLDIAMSGLILTQIAVGVPAYAEFIDAFVETFLRLVGDDPRPSVDAAVSLRRSDPHMSHEELTQLAVAGERLRALCGAGGAG